MSGWSTFYLILGILVLIVSLFSILSFNPLIIIPLFLLSLFLFSISAACDCITKILKNQDEILKRLGRFPE